MLEQRLRAEDAVHRGLRGEIASQRDDLPRRLVAIRGRGDGGEDRAPLDRRERGRRLVMRAVAAIVRLRVRAGETAMLTVLLNSLNKWSDPTCARPANGDLR